MNPPAVPRPPGWASARLARRVSIWAVPRPPGVGGLPGRLPFHRVVRPLVRDAALHLDHGGGPDVARVPRASPGGGRRRGGARRRQGGRRRCGTGRRATAGRVRDACDGIAHSASAPFPPRLLTHSM